MRHVSHSRNLRCLRVNLVGIIINRQLLPNALSTTPRVSGPWVQAQAIPRRQQCNTPLLKVTVIQPQIERSALPEPWSGCDIWPLGHVLPWPGHSASVGRVSSTAVLSSNPRAAVWSLHRQTSPRQVSLRWKGSWRHCREASNYVHPSALLLNANHLDWGSPPWPWHTTQSRALIRFASCPWDGFRKFPYSTQFNGAGTIRKFR